MWNFCSLHNSIYLFTHTHTHTLPMLEKPHNSFPPAHGTAVLKIRTKSRLGLYSAVPNDSSLYFFQDLPGSFQFQNEFYLLVQRLSVRPEGRLSSSPGPTTMDVFPFTDTENNSNSMDHIKYTCIRTCPK